ncbi:MAG TPA: MucR family transcriptional regulator [Rhodospirillaceae bacterium]|nr:MucR family transcriptional regulator [Rhodospirillaceae bacterium]|tara:strand:+ start:349 stop:756 length:408 start_codon:yes stop_codon:yes gene_type:complete
MDRNREGADLLTLTAEIIAAYVANNSVDASDLPKLINSVNRALANIDKNQSIDRLTPAVPIKKSVTQEYIICLEDGKKLKMLKRYLKTAHGMTPEQYRARWGLPASYPMVAPNYARQRSGLAKKIGLGTKNGPIN